MAVSDILTLLVWHLDFCIPSEEPLAAIGGGSRQANNGRHRAHEFQLRDHITSQVDGPYLEEYYSRTADRFNGS